MRVNQRPYFYALFLVAITATLVAYGCLILGMHKGSNEATPYARIVTTAVFGAGLGWMLLQRGIGIEARELLPVAIHFALIGGGAAIGFFSDAPAVYLVSNTAYLSIQLLSYLFFRSRRYCELEIESCVRFFDSGVVIVALLVFSWQLLQLGPAPQLGPAAGQDFVFCGLIWAIFRRRWKSMILFMVVVALGLPELNRATAVAWLAVLPVLLVSMRMMLGRLVGILLLFALSVAGATAAYQAGLLSGTAAERRVSETIDELGAGKSTVPIEQRWYEIKVIQDQYGKATYPWLRLLVGYGTGSVIDLSGTEDVSVRGSQYIDVSMTHNIHFLPGALLYRYGILGTLWWAFLICVVGWFLLDAAVRMWWATNDTRAMLSFICFLYCVLVVLDGMFASSHLLANAFIGGVLGIGVSSRRNRSELIKTPSSP